MKQLIANNKRIIFVIIFVYSLLLYFNAPIRYNYIFDVTCMFSYFVFVLFFFACKQEQNYMDFDTLFFIAYFFVMFFYPVFLYPVDPERFWIFKFKFDEDLISQATSLSLLGISSYMLGSVFYNPKKILEESVYKKINTIPLFFISIVSLFLFIALGGYQELVGMYAGEGKMQSGLYNYFFLLSYVSIFCMIIAWFYNSYGLSQDSIRWQSFPKLQVIYIILFLLLLLYSGSRGKIINIGLITLGLYSYLYKPFTLKQVILLSFIGILMMFFIVLYRSNWGENHETYADVVMDLVLNNRNLYEALEIVEREGLTYGRSMLAYILGVIPFLQGIVFSIFNIDPDTTNSAMIITKSILGTTSETGTGTTIISDIYLSFDVVGVIFFMLILGRFTCYLKMRGKLNLYTMTTYAIMMAFAVYASRAEYFFSARVMVWSLFLMYILHSVRLKIKTIS
ncbi:O-antigen polymerase [Bacteroides muris (ex Afrizal et al. 2022)]|uniref:Oligosaccharide repeat unit polymerase n=2 Tax=Bacteroides TaxID=816 RepID=A0A4S2AL96_9BACE|nr:O-antigen polymerase [Bacteroides muris (ex Afrizal et al. 2022)]TGY01721.1 oligosaccharide repeat unit polymerase [Bacteroides muris (ex Afrizal et al. 2022)]